MRIGLHCADSKPGLMHIPIKLFLQRLSSDLRIPIDVFDKAQKLQNLIVPLSHSHLRTTYNNPCTSKHSLTAVSRSLIRNHFISHRQLRQQAKLIEKHKTAYVAAALIVTQKIFILTSRHRELLQANFRTRKNCLELPPIFLFVTTIYKRHKTHSQTARKIY